MYTPRVACGPVQCDEVVQGLLAGRALTQYQRSEFWYQREAEASNRAQVLWKNTVVVDNVAMLLAILRVPRTIWWQITFVVKHVAMMQRIQGQLPCTCWHCGYVTATGKVLQATPDHSELVTRYGSPVVTL